MLTLMASPKVRMINVRLTPEIHESFKIACDLRGVSMSSLMHQFVVKTIREEREIEPKAFRQELLPAKAIRASLGEMADERKKRKTG